MKFADILERHLQEKKPSIAREDVHGAAIPTEMLSQLNNFFLQFEMKSGVAPRRFPYAKTPTPPRTEKTLPSWFDGLESHLQESYKFFFKYEVKEISPKASAKELKNFYRQMALKIHPDKHPFSSQEEKSFWNNEFLSLKSHFARLLSAARS